MHVAERGAGQMTTTRLEHGRVAIPEEFRKALSLRDGDALDIAAEGGTIVLRPRPGRTSRESVAEAVAEGLADEQAGRTTPAFESLDEFDAYRKGKAYRKLIRAK
jgi:AbrB family looped-hinge helix DNA binding protein